MLDAGSRGRGWGVGCLICRAADVVEARRGRMCARILALMGRMGKIPTGMHTWLTLCNVHAENLA